MAIFHVSHSSIGKSTQYYQYSAAAHANYITRPSAARELIATLPSHVTAERVSIAAWLRDEEQRERSNGRMIDKVMVALPVELTAEQQAALIRTYCDELTGGAVPYVAAIHRDHDGNPHAHIIIRDRDLKTDKRILKWNAAGHGVATTLIRTTWERAANAALERADVSARIDSRSLKERGEDRKPNLHLGPAARALESKGVETERVDVANAIKDFNDAALFARLEADIAAADKLAKAHREHVARLQLERDQAVRAERDRAAAAQEAARQEAEAFTITGPQSDWKTWREDLLLQRYAEAIRATQISQFWRLDDTAGGLQFSNKSGIVRDHGHRVSVLHNSRTTIDLALQLAELKGWKTFEVRGTDLAGVDALMREAVSRGFDVRAGAQYADLLAKVHQEMRPVYEPQRRVVPVVDLPAAALRDLRFAGYSASGDFAYFHLGRGDVAVIRSEALAEERAVVGHEYSIDAAGLARRGANAADRDPENEISL